MPEVRANHTATLLGDGTVLIVGELEYSEGRGGTGMRSSAELFDPARGTWKQLASQLGTARYFHTATLLPNAKVLIAGGIGRQGVKGPIPVSSTGLYDPEYDKVSR